MYNEIKNANIIAKELKLILIPCDNLITIKTCL